MHQSAKVSTTLLSTACPRVLFNAVKRLFEAKRLEVAAPWLSRGFLQAGVPGEGELEGVVGTLYFLAPEVLKSTDPLNSYGA